MQGTAGGKLKFNSLLTIHRMYKMKWLQREAIKSDEKELSGERGGGGRRRKSDRGGKKNML